MNSYQSSSAATTSTPETKEPLCKRAFLTLSVGPDLLDVNFSWMFNALNFGIGLNLVTPTAEFESEDDNLRLMFYLPLMYKYPVTKGINLCASAGPTCWFTYKESIDSFGFTWQMGSEVLFGKKKFWGLTAYTYEFETFTAGVTFKFDSRF